MISTIFISLDLEKDSRSKIFATLACVHSVIYVNFFTYAEYQRLYRPIIFKISYVQPCYLECDLLTAL